MKSTRKVDEEGNISYLNEKFDLHRTDGPARIYKSGVNIWCINGKWHREDGPTLNDIYLEYFLNDKEYCKVVWEVERMKWLDHRGFPMSANKSYL
jgi:hypothetical protein